MFDQVRFYRVSDEQLEAVYDKFKQGVLTIKEIEQQFRPGTMSASADFEDFSLSQYYKMYHEPEEVQAEIATFREKQLAGEARMKRVEAEIQKKMAQQAPERTPENAAHSAFQGQEYKCDVEVRAEVTGKVWKAGLHQTGSPTAVCAKGSVLVILECMKMELPVVAPCDMRVLQILVQEGDFVKQGDVLVRAAFPESE